MKRFAILLALLLLPSIASAQWRFVDGTLRPVYNGNPVTLGSHSTADALRILEPAASGSNYTAFKQPALASNITLQLPTAYATANGQVLSSTTAGALSWATVESGLTIDTTPITGGSSGRILFESATGKVSESANVTWDGTTQKTIGDLLVGTDGNIGTVGNLQLKGLAASATSGRLLFGSDGSGWSFRIAKNVAGTITNLVGINDNGNVSIHDGASSYANGRVFIEGSNAATAVLYLSGAPSQTANIQTWNANGKLSAFDSSHKLGINTTTPSAQLHTVASSATTVGGITEGAAVQSVDLYQWNPAAVTAGTRARVTSAGEFSNTFELAASEAFGAGAIVTGSAGGTTLVGSGAINNGADSATVIGRDANTFSSGSFGGIAIGSSATSRGAYSIAIGSSANTFGNDGAIVIGNGALPSFGVGYGIAIGRSAGFTAANQFVSGAGSYPINDIYFGKGVTNATPTAYTIHGTGGSGTDIAGAAINIASGRGTGAGAPGVLNLQTSDVLTTGTTLQSLVSRFTVSSSISSPNDTVHVSSFIGGATSTNADIAIVPKGSGALLAAVPDSTATGGNKRGANAVDLQTNRSAADQVASGIYSTIGGGRLNRNAASDSVISGGYNNIIDTDADDATISGGNSNTIAAETQRSVIVGGNANSVSSDYGVISGGNTNLVTGTYGIIPGGLQAVANRYGQFAHASGQFAVAGDAQTSVLVGRTVTTTVTPGELFLNGSSLRCTIAADTTWAFTITVVARRTDADNESAAYEFKGCIDNNAGTTALVGTVTKTVLAEDTPAWDCDVTASDANDAVTITVTGENAKTIRWVAMTELTEVSG